MFAEAVAPVMAAMIPLRKELQKLVATVCVDLTVQELRENFGILWEPTTAKSKAGKRAEPFFLAVLVASYSYLRSCRSRTLHEASLFHSCVLLSVQICLPH